MSFSKRIKIGIWGATGSIGTSVLDIVRKNDIYDVVFVSAFSRYEELLKIKEEFNVPFTGIVSSDKTDNIDFIGDKGIREAAKELNYGIMVNAIVGTAGFYPTYEAVLRGKKVALSNKETIVSFGDIILPLAKEKGSIITPIDSEHSALRQLMEGRNTEDIEYIYITASGGPFWQRDNFDNISVEDALKHPTWSMGSKITIDSATLVNKGLEVIEAVRLFNISANRVKVLIHPTSQIHAMIKFKDNSFLMQAASPDMRMPIYYALTGRNDMKVIKDMDWDNLNLIFYEKPLEKFEGLKLAYKAIEIGKTMPAVFNAANEEAVNMFLKKEIGFKEITLRIREVMSLHKVQEVSIESIWDADRWAREEVKKIKG